MRLIDADRIVFHLDGLNLIAPTDLLGICKFFSDQIRAQPEVSIERIWADDLPVPVLVVSESGTGGLDPADRTLLSRAVDRGYFYLARDKDGDAYFFRCAPGRSTDAWIRVLSTDSPITALVADDLAAWDDPLPIYIPDLLRVDKAVQANE